MDKKQLQEAFIQYLAKLSGAQTQQELEAYIQNLGEDGLKQVYAQFMQEVQGQVQSAKNGAKLNYLRELKGQCPDGYELQYFKKGGQLCTQCVQKQQKMEQGGEMPSDPVEAFKCGRKVNKKKCEAGAPIEMDKCGGKPKKKKACGGVKMKFMEDGGKSSTNYRTYTAEQYAKKKDHNTGYSSRETSGGDVVNWNSPVDAWDKPAQVLEYPNGDIYMSRIIYAPGDTVYEHPYPADINEIVNSESSLYPAYQKEFNKHWKGKTQKKEQGGLIPADRCGGKAQKVKKAEWGDELNTVIRDDIGAKQQNIGNQYRTIIGRNKGDTIYEYWSSPDDKMHIYEDQNIGRQNFERKLKGAKKGETTRVTIGDALKSEKKANGGSFVPFPKRGLK